MARVKCQECIEARAGPSPGWLHLMLYAGGIGYEAVEELYHEGGGVMEMHRSDFIIEERGERGREAIRW